MPYIRMATSQTLTAAQKDEFKAGLAEIIGLIPGKTEAALMVLQGRKARPGLSGRKIFRRYGI